MCGLTQLQGQELGESLPLKFSFKVGGQLCAITLGRVSCYLLAQLEPNTKVVRLLKMEPNASGHSNVLVPKQQSLKAGVHDGT